MRNIKDFFSIGLIFIFLILSSSTASAKEIILEDGFDTNLRYIQEAVDNSLTSVTNIAGDPSSWGNLWASAKTIVKGPGDIPQAYFNANPVSGYAPLVVQFTDRSQNATEWIWDFNNDGITDSNEVSPVYTYTTPGTYRPSLRVRNGNLTDITNRVIIVQQAPSGQVLPVANFNANPTRGYAPLLVQFTDRSQNAESRSWDFGDGTNSTERDPAHTYSRVGQYTVILTVSNKNGTALNSARINVEEYRQLPVANFSANVTRGYSPLSVQFTDSSQNATSWNWNFGDRSTSIERNPIHTYSRAGRYTVILRVNNANGTDSENLRITVQDIPISPIANFTANVTKGYAPLLVLFKDTSQYATGRSWDFGDGTNSTEQNPIHIYSAAGTYNVNLKVNNVNGTASKDATITVLKESGSSGGSSSRGSSGGSSRSSSGGSGGGGAGGSPEPQSNVAAKEISQAFVNSGKSVKFDFPRNATPVVYLSFDSKKTAGKTTTIIELLRGKSTLVTGLPSGQVYKSLNIWVGNSGFATSSNIENPVVGFKVDKSWIKDKNISASSIYLYRYNDRKWNQLQTTQLSEDNNYLYFKAETPGFSSLAIASNTITSGTATQPVTTGAKIQPANETIIQPGLSTKTSEANNTNLEAEQKSEQEKNVNLPVFGMICMIALLLVAFLFKIDKP